MTNTFSTFSLEPRARAATAHVAAASAFAALVLRYAREDAIAFTVSAGDDSAMTSVRVAATNDTPLAAITAQVRAQVDRIWPSATLRMAWEVEGASLAIAVRLSDGSVDERASRADGVLLTRAPLAAALRHFEAMSRAPRGATLGAVAIVEGAELARLDAFAAPERAPEIAVPSLLHAIFEERVRATPERVAVEHDGACATYAELAARASRIAARLRARGIGPGACVGLYVPRGVDLYAAMLGILASGAAYVPLDDEWPEERIEGILADCGARAVVTLRARGSVFACESIAIDERERIAAAPPPRAATPDDVAYVIYTSGSTGKPKGVAVTHASAAHLVRVEQRLFGITEDDRVLQGFSYAFDASIEETWLAFAAGATLVAASKAAMLTDLAGLLADARVTVWSTVPTLLASVDGELPTVRLLIVGGEACPQALADRWAPGRAMFNTYGPTEATVIATCARLRAGERVTIGRPIANYRVTIVDGAGHPAPLGAIGEIVIGGVGVARGYVGAPVLTGARFVELPRVGDGVFYRTGDLGRFDDDGAIAFTGRVDGQIKLRGFRIELGEIEAALVEAGAARAVATVREDVPGHGEIVGYVVARAGERVDCDAIGERLRASLAPYMVPSHIEVIDVIPTTTSGKVDRRALPAPRPRDTVRCDARGPTEERIARVWAEALGAVAVSRDQDFFRDLGGHSMLVAQVVSRLRRDPDFATLSVLDVYEHPTVAGLAARAGRLARHARCGAPPAVASRSRFIACGVAQALGLYGILGVHSSHWLAPYLAYVALRHADASAVAALVGAACVLVAVNPLLLLVALAAKWLVIGRYRPGRYPLWGSYYLRYWLVDRLLAIAPTAHLVGTPLLPAYLRLLGARIGTNVHLATDAIRCFDLVSIGDDAAIGADATLLSAAVENGALNIGRTRVGRRCVVGARSVLAPGTTMYDDAALGDLSLLPAGHAVAAGERWAGSPARACGVTSRAPVARPVGARRVAMTAAYAIASLLLPALVVIALLPGLMLLHALDARFGAWSLVASPAVALSFVVAMCGAIALVKWTVVGRAKAGRYDLFSAAVLRHWIFDRAMAMSLDVVGGLYATLYLNPWYRMLGAKLGARAEVSSATSVVPDLLDVGEEAFVADCVSLGAPRVERGSLELGATRIGVRAFVGNSAVVGAGTSVGDDALVGCLSAAPASTERGTSWLGSPPTALAQRQASAAFPATTTYRPTAARVAQRLAIEALRVTMPVACTVALTCLLIDAAVELHARLPLGALLATFPLVYGAFALAAALVVIAVKWAVVGRYRAGERPLWSSFVWRNELVTAMHENLADPLVNVLLRGTPFLAWFFRALGAKIGRRVYMGTTQLTEYDLVEVGDDVCLDDDATLQTHLFEDRVMKASTLSIGDGCSVGAQSVVLYDTAMDPGAQLGPLSLLMKGESLPAGSAWEGTPARAR